MVHCPILAIALAIHGAAAGPCLPTSLTSFDEPSSTIASDTTITTSATTVPPTLAETTSTVSEESTSIALAETTTTAEAHACVEIQVIINPGFDLSDSNKSLQPPTLHPSSSRMARVMPRFPRLQVISTAGNLDGTYRLAYQWDVFSGVNVGVGFSCTITPKVGDDSLPAVYPDGYTGRTSESQTWSSGDNAVAQVDLSLVLERFGEHDQFKINADNMTFMKLCSLRAD
ncbi:hypothetical protein NW762_014839 [Fusarium torreyae]|uniref:Ubiquitin 3 binding protein But2 C-terminal domain-containing protein n=1 Tax=Fusarium torreyae TaxID=1237075 RepID=A0A9W8RLH6_9HYPO|nr:hypothetical protein NW762_014839 [Fusarium torreyae]